MSGAGIMLLDAAGPRGSLCTTNGWSELIEDLQYTLGGAPAWTLTATGRPPWNRIWPPPTSRGGRRSPPAGVAAEARAVFGFPVRIGAARLGALNLYRDRPGPLSDDRHADALVMADVAARAILSMQGDVAPGTIVAELDIT